LALAALKQSYMIFCAKTNDLSHMRKILIKDELKNMFDWRVSANSKGTNDAFADETALNAACWKNMRETYVCID
jgi:hypothetical protein